MTDTLTTAAQSVPVWDAQTPLGYAAMLLAILVATAWHANLWGGK